MRQFSIREKKKISILKNKIKVQTTDKHPGRLCKNYIWGSWAYLKLFQLLLSQYIISSFSIFGHEKFIKVICIVCSFHLKFALYNCVLLLFHSIFFMLFDLNDHVPLCKYMNQDLCQIKIKLIKEKLLLANVAIF